MLCHWMRYLVAGHVLTAGNCRQRVSRAVLYWADEDKHPLALTGLHIAIQRQ